MKERIKRFYQDHKDQIVLGVAAAAATALIVHHKMNGQEIVDVGHWHHPDGRQLIKVDKKNGEYVIFTKTQAA